MIVGQGQQFCAADTSQQLGVALPCATTIIACEADTATDSTSVGEDHLDHEILRMLLEWDQQTPTAPATVQHQQQEVPKPGLLSPSQQQHSSTRTSSAAGHRTEPYPHNNSQQFRDVFSLPICCELSSQGTHQHCPAGSPLDSTAVMSAAATPGGYNRCSPASSNLGQCPTSNLDDLLQADVPANLGLKPHLEACNLQTLLNSMPSVLELDHMMLATGGARCTTPSITGTTRQSTPAAAAGLASAKPARQFVAVSSGAAAAPVLVSSSNSNQQQLGTAASMKAGNSPTPPAVVTAATAGSSRKRGRKLTFHKPYNKPCNKPCNKRQRLSAAAERELESLQHKLATITEENAALRSQVSTVQCKKVELMGRMLALTQKWRSTVAEVARLHQENLALLEKLSAIQAVAY